MNRQLLSRFKSFRAVVFLAWLPGVRAVAEEPEQTAVVGERITLAATMDAMAGPLAYQWSRNGIVLTHGPTLTLASAALTDTGTYVLQVTSAKGTTQSSLLHLTVNPKPSRIVNFSVMSPGRGALTAGFFLGKGGKQPSAPILVRAAGPALAQFGVSSLLPDPHLSLFRGAEPIAGNDDWEMDEPAPAAGVATGAFLFAKGGKDSALLRHLESGSYTVQMADTAGRSGIALVEVFDGGMPNVGAPRLVNLSTLLSADAGENLIAGFSIQGDAPATVLIRAAGPALRQFVASGVLADPSLTLYLGSTVVATNENWTERAPAAIAAAAKAVGAFAFPADSVDAALLAVLSPGSYTAHFGGRGTDAGAVLIEIYEVP